MFDFRYHALSLVAVFLALAVGLLLGVAIGDQGLVSSAENRLREDLLGDVRRAREQSAELRTRLAMRDRFEREIYPKLVGGQLEGRRVALIFLGDSSDRTNGLVRDALAGTGARLRLRAVVRQPLDLAGLADRARGTRYEALGTDPELVRPFGVRIGIQLAQGGRLLEEARPELLRSFSGRLGRLDGVVVARDTRELDGDAARAASEFDEGIMEGLRTSDVAVVGVETTTSVPSQISWFRSRQVASVDNLDDVAGRASLVFALAGAEGTYGVKPTAEALLPPIVGGLEQP